MFRLSIIATLVFFLISCDYVRTYSWNYRLYIEISTPSGMLSTSVVRRVEAKLNLASLINPSAPKFLYDVFGESAILELPNGEVVLTVLEGPQLIQNTLPLPSDASVEKLVYYSNLRDGTSATVSDAHNPWFITFEDRRDPKTIKTAGVKDQRQQLFKGISVELVSVEITNDEPEFGKLQSHLPWLGLEKIGAPVWDPEMNDQAKYLTTQNLIRRKK